MIFSLLLPREKGDHGRKLPCVYDTRTLLLCRTGIEDLKREALARGADVAMFGHTHIPLIEYGDGIVVMNPGSISYPRQEGKRPSYILMDIDKKGMAHYEIEYL